MGWGVTIEDGKKYSQTVTDGFHISNAALENNTKSSNQYVQVMLQHESSEFLLCTLQHGKLLQQSLDLVFNSGETLTFSLNGSGVVHLTGYLLNDDEEDPDFESYGDSSEEEIDAPELVSMPADALKGKRKAATDLTNGKKIKLVNDDDDEDEDDDDDDDDDEEDDDEEEEDFSDDFGDSSFLDDEALEDAETDDDEEDDDDDEDEDDEDMEIESPPKKKTATPQSAKQKQKGKSPETPKSQKKADKSVNGETPKSQKKTKDEKPANGETPKSQKKSKQDKAETPKEQAKKEVAKTPTTSAGEDNESTSAKKKKKKKKNKNKETDDGADKSVNGTPGSQTKTKQRVVAGGTVVEDIKDGHGPEAKPGKMCGIRYVGTLKNGKRFDSGTIKFRLGKGEVIKGWDNGIAGMKVGGTRKLTVPANQGYGNRASGPIPANSVLLFEAELKSVS